MILLFVMIQQKHLIWNIGYKKKNRAFDNVPQCGIQNGTGCFSDVFSLTDVTCQAE